jgi:putative ABC transport system permease protein
MRGIWSDIRLAARLLAKDRRFTVAAVVALALGIGLNTTVFTIINAALLRDVPFDEPAGLVAIQLRNTRMPEPGSDLWGRTAGGPDGPVVAVSFEDLRDWRAGTSSFEGLGAHTGGTMNISDDGTPAERFRGTYVTANLFRLLHVAPIVGRHFVEADDTPNAPGVLMLGYGVWQKRYGGDPSVIGRTVRVNDVPATIIGVMPDRFTYPFVEQVWQSLSSSAGFANATRRTRNLTVVGRLKPGAELGRARGELDAVMTKLAESLPETHSQLASFARPLRWLYPTPPLQLLMTMTGAVLFVLLIAYANLANLLLARSVSRAREIAVRTAVGATRWLIVRQLLIECLLIALVGGALGFGLSLYGVQEIAVAFDVIEPGAARGSTRPYFVDVSPNALVYGFVALLSVGSALAFGLLPAWQIARSDVLETLKEDGRSGGGARRRRWSAALITAQLALTLVLLSGAALLWRGFIQQYRQDTVIDTRGIVTMRLALPAQKYGTPADRKQFLERLDERLSSMPSFESITLAGHVPMEFGAPQRQLFIDGARVSPGAKPPVVSYMLTGARYFEALQIPIVRGRALGSRDALPGEQGAVVDERFAARFFPGGDALGSRIRIGSTGVWFTVVGVARTLPHLGPAPEARPVVYARLEAEPAPDGRAAIIVKSALAKASADKGLAAAAAALREEVRAMDASLPLFAIETLDDALARGRFPSRLISTWFGILAIVALVLAGVGVFAVTAHGVAQRTHEIGVRMALGADRQAVVGLFARRAVVQLTVAVVIGIAGMLALGRLAQSAMREIAEADPLTFAIVTVILATVSLSATLLPARRAARVDPMVALRE